MENVNLHKSKLIALIIAAVGMISCFLPWWKVSFGAAFGLGGGYSINGLHKLGIVAFIAFIAAGILIFAMGDKTKPFGQEKTAVAASFGGAFLFTLITLLANSRFLSFGIFVALVAAAAGAAVVWGIVKVPDSPQSSPPPPPPPPTV